MLVARTLAQVATGKDEIIIRLLNLTNKALHISTKHAVAKFHTLEPDAVCSLLSPAREGLPASPAHLQPLIDGLPGYLQPTTRQHMESLLSEFHTVFSTGPNDMGRTTLIHHEV